MEPPWKAACLLHGLCSPPGAGVSPLWSLPFRGRRRCEGRRLLVFSKYCAELLGLRFQGTLFTVIVKKIKITYIIRKIEKRVKCNPLRIYSPISHNNMTVAISAFFSP